MKATVTEALEIRALDIPEIKILRGTRRSDARGWVAPHYSREALRRAGLAFDIAHENLCYSPKAGTVRGFHYQIPPHAQGKLIQVTRGRILDVNVDLRRGSPTFGRHTRMELDADSWNQTLVPAGFAHCYCTLTDDCEVIFKLDTEFAPAYARGLAWNDPDLAIEWPVDKRSAIVLDRDLHRPRFRDLTDLFPYPVP